MKNIKELRKKSNLTQSKISNMLGISNRNYREKECGHIPFNQLEIMKIIKIFNLNQQDIYTIFYLNGFKSKFYLNDLVKNIR